MTKEEIEFARESRAEEDLAKRSNHDSRKFIRQVSRLFYHLNVDKNVQNALKKDIESGDVFNKFHLNKIKFKNVFSATTTIYDHYNDRTKEYKFT